MGYEFKVDNKDNIMLIRSHGDVTMEELKSQIEDIVSTAEKQKILKVLVDTNEVTSIPPTFDLYEFMSTLPRDMIYATLSKHNQDTLEDLKFAETVSVNRGIRVKHFTKRDEALAWLASF